MLTPSEFMRYERQILYPGFGRLGQERLKESHVVVAGLGGLGSFASVYLTSAGVGHLTLVDCDRVDLSNLNRQVLHWEEDIGMEKPSSAASKLARLNSTIEIVPLCQKITKDNVRSIVKGADAVIDGLDNFETRLVVNSGCVAEGIPLIHGGIDGLLGEVTTVIPGATPCLACIFPNTPKRRDPVAVFGVTPALVAALQVAEAIKLLGGFGHLLTNRMLYVDGAGMEFNFCPLTKNPNCTVCGVH